MSHKCHISSSATCSFLPSGVSPPTPLRNLALKRWRIILVIFHVFFFFFLSWWMCVPPGRGTLRLPNSEKRLRHLLSTRSNNSLAACGFLHEKGILRALIRSLENWTTLKQPSDLNSLYLELTPSGCCDILFNAGSRNQISSTHTAVMQL